ncbi:MAG: MFS transporter [Gammaproteobacteria bacterium]
MPWMIWGTAILFVCYQFILQGSMSVMIPALMRDLRINVTQVGILSADFFITYALFQVPSGILLDHFGVRRVLTIAAFLCGVSCLVFASTSTYSVAVTSRLIMGIMAAPGVVSALFLAGRWFPPERFALLVGCTEMIGTVGGGISEPLLSQIVTSDLGWRGAMVVCGIVGLVISCLILLWVRNQPKSYVISEEAKLHLHKPRLSYVLRRLISFRRIWAACLFCGLLFAGISAFGTLWAVPYLEHVYHINTAQASLAASMIFLGAGISSPFYGWWSDKMKKRKPLMWWGASLSLLFMCIVLYVPHIPLHAMYILLFLLGVMLGCYVISFAIMKELTSKAIQGTVMGFTNMMCVIIGGPILQPLIGWIIRLRWNGEYQHHMPFHSTTDYLIALSILPICFFMAWGLLFFTPETHCRQNILVK